MEDTNVYGPDDKASESTEAPQSEGEVAGGESA